MQDLSIESLRRTFDDGKISIILVGDKTLNVGDESVTPNVTLEDDGSICFDYITTDYKQVSMNEGSIDVVVRLSLIHI